MLETSEERTKLLKLGFSGKDIEKLYIEHNKFKIVYSPVPLKQLNLSVFEQTPEKVRQDEDCFSESKQKRRNNTVLNGFPYCLAKCQFSRSI
jgi:hypothetical protein